MKKIKELKFPVKEEHLMFLVLLYGITAQLWMIFGAIVLTGYMQLVYEVAIFFVFVKLAPNILLKKIKIVRMKK